ncbi:uncharacterized protein LOC113469121 [Diaphorina citri]|uniref:Protein yellow n=1 Tax=Diaphorina citri TaxID=121845 RepID=A0A3Q0J6Q0_DIACI|nr:uncharacterized protein LOC113469121 [Diaphorina citri]
MRVSVDKLITFLGGKICAKQYRITFFVLIGVPSTLNYIPLDSVTSASPNLIPYPSWEANQVPPQPQDQCDTLTTTYRIKADSCDRLWVLDAGTTGLESTTKQICPYAIHVFDLRTDRRIRKYQLRPEDIQPGTFITNIAIDVGKSCEDTFLYASDQLAYGLLSYSWERNTSWRARHGFFFPDPLLGKSSSTRLSVNFRILLRETLILPIPLNYIPLDSVTSASPNLIPYPSWEANQVPPQPQDQCDTLTTTYRIKADSCDRLWVLDAGTTGLESTTKQICPYAIHVFDLRTDRRIRKYQLRPEDIQPGTFITNIAIDVGKSCEDTFLYASDQLAYGLLSYSWERNTSWRARHGFFFPDPLLGKSSSTRLSVNFRILL